MQDPHYRADQWQRRYDPHIAPINRLVDELGRGNEETRPPYIAPMYRGVEARALAILRDPGPKSGGVRGSGFLSVENDDQTAERQCAFFSGAGLDAAEVLPWNAHPWYINAAPTRAQLLAGREPLRRLLDLLPHLRVVLLLGRDAQAAWRLLIAEYGGSVAARGFEALATYHPSRQALQHPDRAERHRREDAIRSTLAEAATLVAAG
jgi:hypothetical protein